MTAATEHGPGPAAARRWVAVWTRSQCEPTAEEALRRNVLRAWGGALVALGLVVCVPAASDLSASVPIASVPIEGARPAPSMGMFGLTVSAHFEEAVRDAGAAGFRYAVVGPSATQLDVLDRHGMRGLVGLWLTRDAAADNVKWRAFLDRVRELIPKLRDHPALYAWYLVDEPDGQRIPPEKIREARDAVRALDPDTPLFAVLDTPGRWSAYLPYFDIVAVDPYMRRNMIGGYDGPDIVASWLERIQADVRSAGRPRLWVVLGAFDAQPKDGGASRYRKPTPFEFREMATAARRAGIEGILVYTYAFAETERLRGWNLPSEDPALWSEVRRLARGQ